MRQYIFDGPQWQWSKAYQATEFCSVKNEVVLYSANNTRRKIQVNIPAEFIRYLQSLHKNLAGLDIRVLEYTTSKGYLFCYMLNGARYDLWYLPELPPAFKE